MSMKTWGALTAIVILAIIGISFYLNGGKTSQPTAQNPIPNPENQSQTASPSRTSHSTDTIVRATIHTTRGDIQLVLYPNVAPKTVDNFVKLAKSRFYDGTKFHRVVPGFVIQGGDPLSKTNDSRVGTGGPGYTFADEINPRALGIPEDQITMFQAQGYRYDFALPSLPVDVGAIAMANAGPNTNGSQFFIVTTAPQPHLNGHHTVFGKVVQGMDVVRLIQQGDVMTSITVE